MSESRTERGIIHTRLTTRLMVGGMIVYACFWWLFDHLHSRDLAQVIDQQLAVRLDQKSSRDTLRIDALLRAHRTMTMILAESDGVRRDASVTPLQGGGDAQIVGGEPPWLSFLGDRKIFPPISIVVITDQTGRSRRIWRVDGGALPSGLDGKLLLFPREDRASVVLLNGIPMLMSASDISGQGGAQGRLVVISVINEQFLATTLGGYLDRGFVLTVSEAQFGRILASSSPADVPPGTVLGQQGDRYLLGSPNLIGRNEEGFGVVFTTLLSRDRQVVMKEPILESEGRQRMALAVITAILFLGFMAYMILRIRHSRSRIAELGLRVFGTVRARPTGDELYDLESEVEHLVQEVERARSALAAVEERRTRLLTEQMALESENERLVLLQAVTEEMGVGVNRIGPEGSNAENEVMRRFAASAGGLDAFIRARTRGEEIITVGQGAEERIYEVMVAPQIDAGLLLVRDVTERSQAEVAVHIFAQFPSQNPHPVLRVDGSGIVTHANTASSRLLQHWGVGEGERVPPEWLAIFNEVLATGVTREIEISLGERVLSLYLVPLPGAGVVNLYGADITGRVAAERLLHMVNESLERRVLQRTEALKTEIAEHVRARQDLLAAKEQADLANRSKSEFLANVSHELRTPLNAIIGFSEVMAAEMFGPLGSPRYKGYVSDVLASGRHLLDVISDILDIAKIESGHMEFEFTSLDPEEVTVAAIRLVESRADASGLRLEANIPDALPQVRADRRRILQILVNLLSNAVKFTPEGGKVEVWLTADDSHISFIVRDTGIGMTEDEVVIALEPFRQVDGSLARRYEGTGLGLPLVRALVTQHGGTLDIASNKGQGTSVTVRIPIRQAECTAPLQIAGE